MTTHQLHAYISGRVQGVWYRASTVEKAKALQLNGWVRNLNDGRVELVAQGERAALEQLLSWCHEGPENAIVDDIQLEWSTDCSESFSSFETRHTV